MIYNIDPKVDCVFKAILGRRSRRHLLLHFLNAMLEDKLRYPLVKVTILNPYSSKDYETDKLHIVDIRAEDSRGRQFQLEIQRKNYTSLPERIVYSWCHLYQEQLEEGMNYDELQPVYSIWLLTESFGHKRLNAAQQAAKTATQTKSQPPPPLRHYALLDESGRAISDRCGGITICELHRFEFKDDIVSSEAQRWIRFFMEAHRLDSNNLPQWMRTKEMRQAQHTLRTFSANKQARYLYLSRLDAQREHLTILHEHDMMEQELQQAKSAQELAQAERDQAIERELRAQAEREQAIERELRAQAEREQAIERELRAQAEREQAQAEREQAQAEREQAQAEREQALAELAELKKRLKL
ncbi:Rpn family recombination-promoting nuclease/putative transposase [Ectothiorhodospiraceae bacterium BW-2]|nr:Rpn family recombination-promoting nuclease/putative transposase [Ectothiorhodospiraceae bacterium BW-2]